MSGSSAGARLPPPCARPIPATDPWHRGVLRLLQLLLVASFAASGVAPSWAAGPVAVGSVVVGPGAMGPGAVDNRPQLVPRSATLPLPGVPAQRGRVAAWPAVAWVARFARAIDAESERLGLRGSSWRNPNGLDARGHRSTAFDLAILARAVLEDRWLARVVERHHPTVPGSMAAAGLARAGATPGPGPVGSAARWSWADRQRLATAAGAVAALPAAVAVAVHRFRQRT
jgi:hypothetical protein